MSSLLSLRRWSVRLWPLLLVGAAAWLLFNGFRNLDPAAVGLAARQWGGARVALAAVCCLLSFTVMGIVEMFALRYAGARPPFAAVMRVAFIANGLAHSLGANLLVAGAVRARLYARHGVGLVQTAEATLFQGASFGLGLTAWAGASLVLGRHEILNGGSPLLGAGCLAVIAGYLACSAFWRGALKVGARRVRLPRLGPALAQLGLGIIDNGLAMAVLWLLLPSGAMGYLSFALDYIFAYLIGLLSAAPAGAGVFEGALLKLAPQIDRAGLAAAFLGFRILYYLAPLALAAALLAAESLRGPSVPLSDSDAGRTDGEPGAEPGRPAPLT